MDISQRQRRGLYLIAGAALLGILLSQLVSRYVRHRVDETHAHLSGFEWFCQEFSVEGEAMARIDALHKAHFPECEEHCVHYADSLRILGQINEDPQMEGSPEHITAAEAHRELRGESVEVFRRFIHEVAEELPEETAERYLRRMSKWLEPSIASLP